MKPRPPLNEALKLAIKAVQGMFTGTSYNTNIMPAEVTREELWNELVELREELRKLKKLKRGVKPKVEDAVRMLLEDERFVEISIDLVADIIRKVFQAYNLECKCSAKAIRWYISQRNLDWDIKKRRVPKPTTEEINVEPEDFDYASCAVVYTDPEVQGYADGGAGPEPGAEHHAGQPGDAPAGPEEE